MMARVPEMTCHGQTATVRPATHTVHSITVVTWERDRERERDQSCTVQYNKPLLREVIQ